ncbi:DUF4157 domain-containing protein [Nostoc sp. CHAB 5836]|uniref:eCIS core domain-containing protein n=1 Tax=Nostoc sp. CHAB 5836 TaxID=2780404 RepID=UPI001E3C6DC7|nr:DUF4157 domain-containing protein [Nostoc sp. CHAB 5836]MCC5616170.1 DUF4157 domain-containing protein [Nostoc sp. CHAB 5836]
MRFQPIAQNLHSAGVLKNCLRGQSLDARLQRSIGQAMGADFGGVKVHTDGQSHQLNRSIQARAFTTGQDVFAR